MRFHIILSPAQNVIPFNYQASLVGVLHRWLGPNRQHDELSLYGFSHLLGPRQIQAMPVKAKQPDAKPENGFFYPQGAHFFIHAHDPAFFIPLAEGIRANPSVFGGMQVEQIEIESTLTFEEVERVSSAIFLCRSPIFLKYRRPDDVNEKFPRFAYYDMAESDELLTAVMHSKLRAAGLSTEGCRVSFERTIRANRRITAVTYRNMYLKASICPVRIDGTPEQIIFAWNVGAGHSTGIGFGALDYLQVN